MGAGGDLIGVYQPGCAERALLLQAAIDQAADGACVLAYIRGALVNSRHSQL